MSITINATAGDAAANSYVTEVEAIAYMATRLNVTGWVTITGATCTEPEKAALIEATRELTPLTWKDGQRATSTQTLAWPRIFATNPDTPLFAWSYFSSTVVPQRVKDATCELAFQFLKAGTTDIAALDPTISVVRKKVDVLETQYAEPWQRARGLARFPSVMRFIRVLLAGQQATSALVRG